MKRIRLCLVIVLVLACFGQVSAQDRTYDHFFLEAMVQRQKGNNDAAFDLLRHCVELNPEAAEAWYFLAQYYNALKDQEKSQACIQKAASIAPENLTYMETLAQIYISQQDYAAAMKAFYLRRMEIIIKLLVHIYQT